MSDTTKFILNSVKVYGLILWMAVLYYYGIYEVIADIISAVFNNQNTIVCYK